ncbi:D-alanyl-D-alanine carboxypeptidase [Agromyces endophyticus]|uniref:D-alanyl-D-alanine carboxypeptidase/D-alanyl-D-alanine-endopeptidase n=1 Tax=Agromyces sp. H17E-10 TaxID=2932244 RepID=UPI001FD16E01|nr:D-alanyl-D-alanine carboxypeptidase [Agromyces sp. H17E-10]UOQ89942.1 D-alanyl-D-alanine carboxypeptidase [Agromyces sp. H17E-10]
MNDETDAPGETPGSVEPSSTTDTDAATPRTGASFIGFVRKHRVPLAIVGGVVALALAGTAAVFAGAATVAEPTAIAAPTPSETPTPTPEARPVPTAAPVSRIRTCSVADRAADARLANLQAQVLNAKTGEVLYDRGGTTASRTASVMKVLTSAAALSVLGPDHRAATTVVKGAEPGSIVLVGGGDVTLSRTPSGDETVYPGAAHLDDLAAQVQAAWAADPANPPITKLILDASYFGGDEWQPSWELVERDDGYMSNITALMVDGDRDDPYSNTSTRSDDPISRAGVAFADALGGVATIERGTAPAGAQQLGQVLSPTVAELVDKALVVSDNTVAEMLARLVAIETGSGNTFSAINAGVLEGLAGYGVDTAGITIVDGSGLSDDNAVPPAYLTRLFVKINAREGNLGYLLDSLPVAGERGSLSYDDRFWGDNAVADGSVIAKTGWINTGYTLAGVIRAEDGTDLTFAIYALGDVTDEAKTAIDTLATGFYLCGDNLSNQ